jgi:predicted O-methyltransferase YrrM
MARKPLIGTVAANVLAHGTGALNVDACRIAIHRRTRARIIGIEREPDYVDIARARIAWWGR